MVSHTTCPACPDLKTDKILCVKCFLSLEALSKFWTSGKRTGVVDVSQNVDRMATKKCECPCLTPNGKHFLVQEKRPLTGWFLLTFKHVYNFQP